MIGAQAGLGTALMVFANVWFRHTIFLFYPLSNVLITTSAITGYGVDELAIRQAPVAAFMVAVGAAILWPHLRGASAGDGGGRVLAPLTPIVVALSAAIVLRYGLTYLAMPLGVAAGAASIWAVSRPGLRDLLRALSGPRAVGLAVAGFTIILIQKSFVLSGASDAVASLAASSGLPLVVLEVGLPAVIGTLTGSPLTGIVTSLPILSSIAPLSIRDVSLVYVSSIVSYIGSPAHLCLVYTAQYFGEPVTTQYRYMIPAIALTMAFAIALYLLW